MKTYRLFIVIITLIFSISAFGQEKPIIGFEDLIINAEEDAQILKDVRLLTAQLDIPHTIYLPEGIFIEARGIENGKVVYAVIQNIIDIYDSGVAAYWDQIVSQYDLSRARQHFTNGETINPTV